MKKRILSMLLAIIMVVGLLPILTPMVNALEEIDVIGISGTRSATLSPDNTGEDFYNFIMGSKIWKSGYSPYYQVEGSYIRNVVTNTIEQQQIEIKLSDCSSTTFTDGTYKVYLKTHNNLAGDSRAYFYHMYTVEVQVRYTVGYSASGAPSGYGGIKVNGGNASNSGSVTVVPNGSVSFEVVEVPGHKAEVDTGGATYSKSGNTYTYSSVGQNFNFKVTYTPTDYATVTFTQPEGATITVNGSTTSPVQVISGMNYNVSVAAATGYRLTEVKFDGTSQTVTNDATSSFTFTAGANGTTHTVSASTLKHTITVKDTATFSFNRGMTSSQIVTGLFNTIYEGSTLKEYTASDVNVKYDDGKVLSLEYWGKDLYGSDAWINLTDSILTWDKLVHSIGGLQMQFRLSNGTITSNTCTVTLIDNSISANGTISKPYTGEAVSLSMTNGEDFTWTTHSGYASSSLAVYQYYDSSKNPISAPSAVGSYYVRLCLTENYDPIGIGAEGEISYSDYIPFSITKATLDSITISDTIVPVVGAAPVSSVSDFGYNATITWSPNVSSFDYNSEYTATITLNLDSNCEIAANAAVNVPAAATTSEIVSRETDKIVVQLTFKTAKEKIISVSAANTALERHYVDAAAVLGANVLPATVTVTAESGTVEMPVTWSFNGTYSTAPKAENSFTWVIEANAYADYNTNGVAMSGTAKVTNAEALSVNNTVKDDETTYTDEDFSYDVTKLFGLDENAGTPTYTLVEGGDGVGTLDSENKLTITKAGTFKIQVTTAAKGIYAAGKAVTATLIVNKGTQAALTITQQPETVTYGDVFTLGAEGGTTVGTVTWAVTSGSDSATVDPFTGEVTVIGVGEVTITATMAGNALYNDVVSNGYTFTPATRAVTISGTTVDDKAYDGKTTAIGINSGTVSGAVFGDELSVSVIYAEFEDADAASGKTVELRFELVGTKKDCYHIDTEKSQMTATAAITPLDISTGADVGAFEALTYNGSEQTPAAVVEKNGLTVTGSWSNVTNVSDTTTFEAYGNFSGTIENMKVGMLPLNIENAEIILGEALTYNGEEQLQTVSKVLVGELEVTTYDIRDNAGTDATSYTLTVIGNSNFTGTATKDFAIEPKSVTVTAKNQSYHTGTKLPETFEEGKHYTIEGLVEGDSLGTVTIKYQKNGEDVTPNQYNIGIYYIVPVVTDPDANYDITFVNGKLTYYYIPIIIPTYSPVVEDSDNGDVVVAPASPKKDDSVTITPAPDAGYEVDEVIVIDKNGDSVTVVDNGDGTYSFKQPSGKVNIEVTFKEIDTTAPSDEPCPMYDYTDLDTTAWYHLDVDYVLNEGMMNGMGDGIFAPNGNLSRAMLVTILWRLEGKPAANYIMTFEDVDAESWYGEAVRWAASEGIVEGYSDKAFGPNDDITREQLAAIIYRYEQYKGGGFTGTWMFRMDYTDLEDVSEWAYEAMCWCVMNGIINGKPEKLLDPLNTATRAEAAAMLHRYCEKDK